MSHHNELKISQEDEFFSEIFRLFELEYEGDQILKILLSNILLFNKRVVQPSTMAYVKCVRKKVKLCGLWFYFIFSFFLCLVSNGSHPTLIPLSSVLSLSQQQKLAVSLKYLQITNKLKMFGSLLLYAFTSWVAANATDYVVIILISIPHAGHTQLTRFVVKLKIFHPQRIICQPSSLLWNLDRVRVEKSWFLRL